MILRRTRTIFAVNVKVSVYHSAILNPEYCVGTALWNGSTVVLLTTSVLRSMAPELRMCYRPELRGRILAAQ